MSAFAICIIKPLAEERIIGAGALAWPLTFVGLCNTHMLVLYLCLRLFVIIVAVCLPLKQNVVFQPKSTEF